MRKTITILGLIYTLIFVGCSDPTQEILDAIASGGGNDLHRILDSSTGKVSDEEKDVIASFALEATKSRDIYISLIDFGIRFEDSLYPGTDKAFILWAVLEDDLPFLETLIESGYSLDISWNRSDPILRYAIASSTLEIVKLLLDSGAPLEDSYVRNKTPLGYATAIGNIEAVLLLIEMGAEIETQDSVNNIWLNFCDGWVDDYLEIAEDLIENDGVGIYPETLHRASEYGLYNYMEWLLMNGQDPNYRDSSGQTPYDWLSRYSKSYDGPRDPERVDHQAKCTELLRDYGANIGQPVLPVPGSTLIINPYS